MTPALTTSTLLAALLLAALVSDLRSRRIPNSLVLAGLTLAIGGHALSLAQSTAPLAGTAWWAPLAGLATGFALLLPLYLLRAMGAGDVKLMAMVGAFVGPTGAATAVLYTLIAGGLLSLAFMCGRRGVAAQTFANLRFLLTDWVLRASSGQGLRLTPLQTTAARLPYALAITLGTAATVLWPLAAPRAAALQAADAGTARTAAAANQQPSKAAVVPSRPLLPQNQPAQGPSRTTAATQE